MICFLICLYLFIADTLITVWLIYHWNQHLLDSQHMYICTYLILELDLMKDLFYDQIQWGNYASCTVTQSFYTIILYCGGIPKWWKYRIFSPRKALCLKYNNSHCFIYNMLIQLSTGPENFQSLNINLPKPFPIFQTFFPFFPVSSMYSVEKNGFF